MLASLVCALFLALLPAAPASAAPPAAEGGRPGELNTADMRAVRAVIEAQLKAIAADDAAGAYAQAAPAIQQQFRNAASFAQMVQRSYPMLIRPASVSFYRPISGDGAVVQSVLFRDRGGRTWRADYQLQRQPDGRWRISGCQVAPGDESSTT